MPKHWGKQIFSLGRFPEVGQKQKKMIFGRFSFLFTASVRSVIFFYGSWFLAACLLFTASVRLQPPGPTLVPTVFLLSVYCYCYL